MNTELMIAGKPVACENVERKNGELSFTLGGKAYRFRGRRLKDGGFLLEEQQPSGLWQSASGTLAPDGKGAQRVTVGMLEAKVAQKTPGQGDAAPGGELSPAAPMPGTVRQVMVKAGEKVKKDQPLVILEAMKLQLTLAAGGDGVVEKVLVKVGELVSEGAELVKLTPLPLAGGVGGERQ